MGSIPQSVLDAAARIRRQCHTQMEMLGADARVALIVPGRMGKAPLSKKRLAGRSGPVGEAFAETTMNGRDAVLCYFSAADVLRWLDRVLPTPTPPQEEP